MDTNLSYAAYARRISAFCDVIYTQTCITAIVSNCRLKVETFCAKKKEKSLWRDACYAFFLQSIRFYQLPVIQFRTFALKMCLSTHTTFNDY